MLNNGKFTKAIIAIASSGSKHQHQQLSKAGANRIFTSVPSPTEINDTLHDVGQWWREQCRINILPPSRGRTTSDYGQAYVQQDGTVTINEHLVPNTGFDSNVEIVVADRTGAVKAAFVVREKRQTKQYKDRELIAYTYH